MPHRFTMIHILTLLPWVFLVSSISRLSSFTIFNISAACLFLFFIYTFLKQNELYSFFSVAFLCSWLPLLLYFSFLLTHFLLRSLGVLWVSMCVSHLQCFTVSLHLLTHCRRVVSWYEKLSLPGLRPHCWAIMLAPQCAWNDHTSPQKMGPVHHGICRQAIWK